MLLNEILSLSKNDVLIRLRTSPNGLSPDEIEKNRQKFGLNLFKKGKNYLGLIVLANQAKNSLFYILLIAGILSYFLGSISNVYIIAAVLLLNTFLGFYEEYRSEKAVEKLQKFLSRKVIVTRNGNKALINEEFLLPGDIVLLKEGDLVPADIRLLSAEGLLVDESQLTGEEAAIIKQATDGVTSRDNLLFAGSTVQKGEATGVVYAIAFDTELGKIALLSQQTHKTTRYESTLQEFSSLLIKIILVSLVIIFIARLLITQDFSNLLTLSLFVVALAITVIPEALPAIATVSLSLGAMKLAKHHVISKSLAAAEDFGNIAILCTDKTGTLTENEMVVTNITSPNQLFLRKIARAVAASSANIKKIQNSYDEAILNYLTNETSSHTFEILRELPFDPSVRRSRVVLKDDNKFYLVAIGAAETLLQISQTPQKEEYLQGIKNDGLSGLRHLAYAYREINSEKNLDLAKAENGLEFLGYFTFENPLRKTTLNTILLAEKLGVQIKILSGDSPEVTQYVAQKIGLLEKGGKVYTGEDIDKLSDNELAPIAHKACAFSQLNPEQKYRIIRLLKKDNVVAYQGDGINDAPALKLADVSIAVNSATDISKENADIVLLRKDIHVIIGGIKYGRIIFQNINKYIRYTMVGNFGIFFALGILFLFSKDLPLTPMQLLLIGLLTDLPLLAISTDNVGHEELQKPSHISIKKLMRSSLILGLITTVFILLFYFISRSIDLSLAQTSLFLFFTISQLAVIFSVRGKDYFWHSNRFSPPLLLAFIFTFFFSLLIIYLPWAENLFSLVKLPIIYISIILMFTIIYLLVLDTSKIWLNKFTIKEKHGNN